METIIPSAKILKNKTRDEVKRILMMAGFRPVKKGELPEKGDRVIKCNVIRGTYNSNTTFQSGIVEPSEDRPYFVVYDKIKFAHNYSKSWFERVMWIRKTYVKSVEKEMEEREDYVIGSVFYVNKTKREIADILKNLSDNNLGETIVAFKLVRVAVAYKKVEPEQVQWL